MGEEEIYNNPLFFPLSEGVASPFNQVFLIFHYDKKNMLIIRPLKYSPKTNININHQPRTKHKKKRLKVTIKSSPFFVCWFCLMGCKTGKIQPSQDEKCQISRNIKRLSGFGGNGRGILHWYSIQKAGLLNVVLFILDVKQANRARIKKDDIVRCFFSMDVLLLIEK